MAHPAMVNGQDITAIVQAVLAALNTAPKPENRRQRRYLARTGKAFATNTATTPVPQTITAPLPIPNKRLEQRQARVLNTSSKAITTANTATSAINLPPAMLNEARSYATSLDAAWDAWRKGGKAANLLPKIDNPNEQLSQAEVLDILGQCAPAIHALCYINTIRGPWLWIPTKVNGLDVLPKHPDVRAFLKWLGFEWVGGQKMWLHKVNTQARGKFPRGKHDLKSELSPIQ